MTTATARPATMPVAGHLREGRRRIIRVAAALAVAMVIAYLMSDQVLEVLRAPVVEIAQTRAASINYDSITGAFDLKLRIALYGGIAVSSPVWLYQLLAYIAPALSRHEKRYTFGFLAAVIPLFTAGCVAGVAVFPRIVELLAGFASTEDSTLLQASYYLDFVMKLVLAAGIAFTLPAFIVVLNVMGLLPAATLARSWRGITISIVVFSALVTPAADLLSMFLIAVPMAVLFGLALFIAWIHDRHMTKTTGSDATDSDAGVTVSATLEGVS
ncbi:twin-arginine translocase subunit TatC [Corynebacterium glyciniphilum]|uniref:twin-arginine translocase subunit TatC n=1 Tax=Corynebacterium glyciniphilum TaxID=1404244 RepID=UPI003FD50E4D